MCCSTAPASPSSRSLPYGTERQRARDRRTRDPLEVKPKELLRPRGFARARESRSLGRWLPPRLLARDEAPDRLGPRRSKLPLRVPDPTERQLRGSSSRPATEQKSGRHAGDRRRSIAPQRYHLRRLRCRSRGRTDAVSALTFQSPLARIGIETLGPVGRSRHTRSRRRCGNSPDRHHRGKRVQRVSRSEQGALVRGAFSEPTDVSVGGVTVLVGVGTALRVRASRGRLRRLVSGSRTRGG